MRIGVLALQGDFREHFHSLTQVGVSPIEVRLPRDLEQLNGLIIPGGESTTIGRLAREFGLESAVRERFENGQLALWGTCAGAIWLARDIDKRPQQERLGVMDMSVGRNAFGRQIDSFESTISIPILNRSEFTATFIRAPRILKVGPAVEILATWKQEPVLVKQGRAMASTFHPELSSDPGLHAYFVETLAKSTSNS